MTKVRLVPLYFVSAQDPDFAQQVANLWGLISANVEILEPVPLGAPLPKADAVVFPQLLGKRIAALLISRRSRSRC